MPTETPDLRTVTPEVADFVVFWGFCAATLKRDRPSGTLTVYNNKLRKRENEFSIGPRRNLSSPPEPVTVYNSFSNNSNFIHRSSRAAPWPMQALLKVHLLPSLDIVHMICARRGCMVSPPPTSSAARPGGTTFLGCHEVVIYSRLSSQFAF